MTILESKIEYSGNLNTELVWYPMVKKGWMLNGLDFKCHLINSCLNYLLWEHIWFGKTA